MGKRLETLVTLTCLKGVLMIFNALFWISGIAIICVGIWAKISLYVYTQLSMNNYAFAPYTLIGIGALIIAVGTLGCCCTVKGHTRFLYVYAVVLFLIFLIQVIAGISFYVKKDKIALGFEKGLNYSISHYPKQDEKALDYLQKALRCCGVSSYRDWFSTPYGSVNTSVPQSCCRNMSQCVRSHLALNETVADKQIYTIGCHNVVVSYVKKNMAKLGGMALAIAFFHILGFVFSFYLAKVALKAQYQNLDE